MSPLPHSQPPIVYEAISLFHCDQLQLQLQLHCAALFYAADTQQIQAHIRSRPPTREDRISSIAYTHNSYSH